jgi:hypothetical protein
LNVIAPVPLPPDVVIVWSAPPYVASLGPVIVSVAWFWIDGVSAMFFPVNESPLLTLLSVIVPLV